MNKRHRQELMNSTATMLAPPAYAVVEPEFDLWDALVRAKAQIEANLKPLPRWPVQITGHATYQDAVKAWLQDFSEPVSIGFYPRDHALSRLEEQRAAAIDMISAEAVFGVDSDEARIYRDEYYAIWGEGVGPPLGIMNTSGLTSRRK